MKIDEDIWKEAKKWGRTIGLGTTAAEGDRVYQKATLWQADRDRGVWDNFVWTDGRGNWHFRTMPDGLYRV